MPATLGGAVAWAGDLTLNWLLLLLAVLNLGLVVFDYTYLEARPLYLSHAPAIAALFDPVLGISPERDTLAYVQRAQAALAVIRQQPGTPAAHRALQEMRARSLALYQVQPFAEAGLEGRFEQIKNRLRHHLHLASARQAFLKFWSAQNLTGSRLPGEQRFFERRIRPVMQENYFRAIGENGKPFDGFWKIDLYFLPPFILEFLLSGIWGVRQGKYPSWKAFVYARWFELAYFVPAGRWVPLGSLGWLPLVRGISVGRRMRRLGLINPMAISQGYVNRVVELSTDLVTLRLLSNCQESVRKLDLARSLEELPLNQLQELVQEYLGAIASRLIPAIAPELETLMLRAFQQALDGSAAYRQLRGIPLLGSLPDKILPELVTELVAGARRGLDQTPEQRELMAKMAVKFRTLLVAEMTTRNTEHELKELAISLLERQKQHLLA